MTAHTLAYYKITLCGSAILTVKCKLDVPASALDAIGIISTIPPGVGGRFPGVAWETKTFGKVKLHHATYYPTRERTGLQRS